MNNSQGNYRYSDNDASLFSMIYNDDDDYFYLEKSPEYLSDLGKVYLNSIPFVCEKNNLYEKMYVIDDKKYTFTLYDDELDTYDINNKSNDTNHIISPHHSRIFTLIIDSEEKIILSYKKKHLDELRCIINSITGL